MRACVYSTDGVPSAWHVPSSAWRLGGPYVQLSDLLTLRGLSWLFGGTAGRSKEVWVVCGVYWAVRLGSLQRRS